MFQNPTDKETARRLMSLMIESRSLARRYRGAVCVTVYSTDFTVKVVDSPLGAGVFDDLLLPANAAIVTSEMDDEALGVCAVQIATTLKPHCLHHDKGPYEAFVEKTVASDITPRLARGTKPNIAKNA